MIVSAREARERIDSGKNERLEEIREIVGKSLEYHINREYDEVSIEIPDHLSGEIIAMVDELINLGYREVRSSEQLDREPHTTELSFVIP